MIKSKLRILLAIKNMNQKQLTELTGIRPGTISKIVNNQIRQIPIDALNEICKTLNCKIEDVFEYIEE